MRLLKTTYLKSHGMNLFKCQVPTNSKGVLFHDVSKEIESVRLVVNGQIFLEMSIFALRDYAKFCGSEATRKFIPLSFREFFCFPDVSDVYIEIYTVDESARIQEVYYMFDTVR